MESRIRQGGRQAPSGFLFELSSGNLALDLVNTLKNRRTADARELIPRPLDLVSWAKQSGLLSPNQDAELREKARHKPRAVEHLHRRTVQLRECLFELFGSVADSRDTAPDVLVEWNKFLSESLARHETVRTGDRLEWALRSEIDVIDTILWRVVHSAFELLTGPQAARVRRCAGDRCDWLFVDTSKRGNRRWCDMSVCGNQAKARRFYRRKKIRQTNKANS